MFIRTYCGLIRYGYAFPRVVWQDFGGDHFADNDNDNGNDGGALGSAASSVGRGKHGKEVATGGDGKAELM